MEVWCFSYPVVHVYNHLLVVSHAESQPKLCYSTCSSEHDFSISSDKKGGPKSASDIKLINAGKILENNKTVGQCRTPFGELPKGVITMHAVVQMSLTKAKTGKFV